MHFTKLNFFSIQFRRYAMVGLASNAILYVLYLLLTALGISPKLSATSVFLLAILFTYFCNRLWTFQGSQAVRSSFLLYALAYFSGYLINIGLLHIFVDLLGVHHAIVQACAIILVALYLFTIQRHFIFTETANHGP